MIETTPGGFLLVLILVVPVTAMLIAFAMGGHAAQRIALAAMPVGLAMALMLMAGVLHAGAPITYLVGGFAPPLGLALRADGLNAAMLVTTALVMGAVGLHAQGSYGTVRDSPEARAPFAFWLFFLALWAALNAAFLGGDLFNLFVALEMLTFGALALACLDGRASQFKAELRYLLFALIGSVLYLLGTALLYGAYGTLDVVLLAQRIAADPATIVAAALMTVGLLAKMALFPLHLWLPAAHAGAPPAASALLSGLVVKASYFLLLRLWFAVFPLAMTQAVAPILALLGAGAILFGSLVALRQTRLKLLIAYSTVAQIGYLFLMFPLVAGADPEIAAGAWTGGALQAISHAFAKAAMFLAAGIIAGALGHDRIAEMDGAARVAPLSVLAFGLAGLSLMGIPPSGGFSAKWLLLIAALETGQWWWAMVIVGGGLLTGFYVFRVLAVSLAGREVAIAPHAPVSRMQEGAALGLAVLSVVLGLMPLASFGLVQIGRALP